MPSILGMSISKISAERKKNAGGPVEITTQPSIVDVSELKISGLAKDLSALNVDFTFSSSFTPDTGHIDITGSVIYRADNPEALLKEWKKNRALPALDGTIILNHIFSKVSIIGLYLSDMLQLPPIVGLPKVEANKKEEKKQV